MSRCAALFQKSHTPVKTQQFKHTSDGTKLIIHNLTKYSFQYSEDTMATLLILSVAKIFNSFSDWNKVIIYGNIVYMCDQELACQNNLRLVQATFTDTTETITIALWEENIARTKIETVYQIAPIQVHVWKKIKKNSTMHSSAVTPETDTTIVQLQIPEEQMKFADGTLTVSILNVHTIERVETFVPCVNCTKQILQGTCNVVPCDWRGHAMKIFNCPQYVCAKLVIHFNGQ